MAGVLDCRVIAGRTAALREGKRSRPGGRQAGNSGILKRLSDSAEATLARSAKPADSIRWRAMVEMSRETIA